MKTYYRKAERARGNTTVQSTAPAFRYYCVMDVEATCVETGDEHFVQEIIELPVIVIDSDTGRIVSGFTFDNFFFRTNINCFRRFIGHLWGGP